MTTGYRWRKSSRSNTETACIELAHTLEAVRDSKNPSTMIKANLSEFIATVKAGKLNH